MIKEGGVGGESGGARGLGVHIGTGCAQVWSAALNSKGSSPVLMTASAVEMELAESSETEYCSLYAEGNPSALRSSPLISRTTTGKGSVEVRTTVHLSEDRTNPCLARVPRSENCGQQMGTPPRMAVPGWRFALDET